MSVEKSGQKKFMNNDNNDNIYFLFKDMSNKVDKKSAYWSVESDGSSLSDKKIFHIEPKLNKQNSEWSDFQKWLLELGEDKIEFKEPKPDLDFFSKVEDQVISLLNTLEDLLEFLEDRRHNNSSDPF